MFDQVTSRHNKLYMLKGSNPSATIVLDVFNADITLYHESIKVFDTYITFIHSFPFHHYTKQHSLKMYPLLRKFSAIEWLKVFKFISGMSFTTTPTSKDDPKYSLMGSLVCAIHILLNCLALYNAKVDNISQELAKGVRISGSVIFFVVVCGYPAMVLLGIDHQWQDRRRMMKKMERVQRFAELNDSEGSIAKSMKRWTCRACIIIVLVEVATLVHHSFNEKIKDERMFMQSVFKVYHIFFVQLITSVSICEVCVYFQQLEMCFASYVRIVKDIKREMRGKVKVRELTK